MAGDKGPSFTLSRSVRQGCPLAPYLFLFVAEAMSLFLRKSKVGLKGLSILTLKEEIVDAEFADDIALYLEGNVRNLKKAKEVIHCFFLASGASIKWNKTTGFWISEEDLLHWSPDFNFRCIPKGEVIRYLGCQIGIGLSAKQQIAPLLLTIRHKLLFWSSAKLSLSGREIIVNYVLLSSIWYILSCWIFSKSCINQIRRIVRSFLWSGKGEGSSRAKVVWTLPTSRGGLGIVDLVDQSRALLSKLVIRSLQPRDEVWKKLFVNRMYRCAPSIRKPWKDEVRWIFSKDIVIKSSKKWEDCFINGIWKAWKMVREGLAVKQPECEEELRRQPLIWNTNLSMGEGNLLGSRSKLAWGKMSTGPASSLENWMKFIASLIEIQEEVLKGMRGGESMYREINMAVDITQFGYNRTILTSNGCRWAGKFIENAEQVEQLDVQVYGIDEGGRRSYFSVAKSRRFTKRPIQIVGEGIASYQQVRMIMNDGKRWLIDPSTSIIGDDGKMRIYGNHPLVRLQWDPREYVWKDSQVQEESVSIPFFQYSVQLGRRILAMHRKIVSAVTHLWSIYGITNNFISGFWKKLWERKQAHKIITLQWLIIHRALPMGQWLRQTGISARCACCNHEVESQYHSL